MKHLFAILLFVFTINGFSQKADTTVYTVVDEMPEYPGGTGELMKYLQNKIQISDAEKNCYMSKIFIGFVIDENGKPVNPVIHKYYYEDCPKDEFEKNLKSVISGMPDWKPGKLKGKPVKVRFNLPIYIHLK